MKEEIFVYVDLNATTYFVGRLWARSRNNRESASFEYSREWLQNKNKFALEPALTLIDSTQHTPAKKSIFGALGDSAPDRWGRILMRRAERQKALKEKKTPATLREIDYLLKVNDTSRQGALRFSLEKEGPFLNNNNNAIPPLIELPKLLNASEKLADENETVKDLQLLLAPGSSLGGARPKASIIDKDHCLAIAKFPQKQDENNTVLWEAVALTLASKAGINTPEYRIEKILNKPVLISKRFDRDKEKRIPYLSAMSMLGANDNETRSYLEIVDALRQYGKNPSKNIEELWSRMVFNILISNTDDHLRNHAFLYGGAQGWQLSPAFDLNPIPTDLKPRILSTNVDLNDGTASIELALSVADYFNLKQTDAKAQIKKVAEAVSKWQAIAKKVGLKKNEIDHMASAFQHKDLEIALKF